MKTFNCWLLSSTLAASLLVGGCTHTRELNVKTPTFTLTTGQAKTPIHAALVLDPDLTAYKPSISLIGGDKLEYPLGASLKEYSEGAARAVFEQVTVYSSSADAAGKADAILIPKVARFNTTLNVGASSKRQLLLRLQWRMMDAKNHAVLWLETVDGIAEQKTGMTKGRERKMFQAAFDNLSLNTITAFRQSPAIEKLTKKQ